MSFGFSKKHNIRIIIFLVTLVSFQFLSNAREDKAGPVIASVNINSCVGSITISVTSGVAPYTYVWKDSGGGIVPSTTFIASGLSADVYTVTVTDNIGDSVTATYSVTNPPDLTGSVVVNDVTCRGDSDAQVVVTMANGNPGYDWVLNNGGGAQVGTGNIGFPSNIITIGGLGVDSYTLLVTDQDGCTGTINFVVTQPTNFLGVNLVNQTNATCSDLANGSLEVVGTGGWGGYTYQWYVSGTATFLGNSATLSGLLPGDYQVFVTDANGCVLTQTYTITSPAPIVATATITNTSCNGDSDGAIDVTVTGGNGGYTYSWSNGSTSQDLSGVAAGTYTLTINDNLACILVEAFTVTEPAVLTINEAITQVDCFGDNTGRIRSNVSGGTAPYTYAWSTGNTGRNLNNRTAGNYSLTVTDVNGCSTFESFTITEPAAALSVQNLVSNQPSCFGASDGNLTVTMQGGTAPYTYAWSNGSTGTSTGAISAGNYSLTITDANGCSRVENYTLNDPIRIAVTPTLTLPTCNGGGDGIITVVASNGTAPYTYNWNTGATGPTINSLAAGTYQVTVSDAGGCSVIETIVLGEPAVISGNSVTNDISCHGLIDGSVFLAVTGGTGPYTYVWNTGATTSNISGLSAGAYSVTITDASGCSKVENYTVIEPAAIQANFTKVDVLCNGNTTGSIDLSPSGGTTPYSYVWSNGSTTQDVSGLAAGNYSVTVKDASNCSVVVNVTITQPATAVTVGGVITNVTCNGSVNGSIDVSVLGGVGPYSYTWNTGAISQDLTNVVAGSYSVQVTDANGCTTTESFTVTQPAPIAVPSLVNQISCNGANDGSINLTVSGGTSPYSYSWSDGPTTEDRSSLGPGSYTITVTDNNGCQNVQSFTITEPLTLTNSFSKQDILCFGESTGIINISPSGGTTPYSFVWSNGALTEDLNGVPAGTYTATITDANGCQIVETISLIEPAAALSFTDAVGEITCNGAFDGSIALTVSGGTAPYSFNWSNGSTNQNLSNLPPGNYDVTITDANGCTVNSSYTMTDPPVLGVTGTASDELCAGAGDGAIDITVSGGEAPFTYIWSNGDNTEDINSLSPGNYTVQVVDNRGCSIAESFVISGPTALNVAYTQVDVACFGDNTGSIDVTITGGTAPYAYSWSNGSSAEDLNSISSGTYTLTVTDANGCVLAESIIVSQPSQALTIVPTVTDIACFGANNGSVELVITGGTAPYTYAWDNGQTTRDIFGLLVGNYQVVVTDANGCTTSGTYPISSPQALQLTSSIQDLSCNASGDGIIDISIVGGVAPYSYLWSDASVTQDLNNIAAGNYQVLVTDANGCTISRSFTVTEPLALVASASINDVDCFGTGDGSIEVTITGGTSPYTYQWSSGEVTEDLFNISGGNYSLTVTDASGCSIVQNYVVAEPVASLDATGSTINVNCFGANNGSIVLNVTGGTAPYTYSWNQGSISKDISVLSPGGYQVEITDSNGCSVTRSFTITGPDPIQIAANLGNVSCNGLTDGQVDITVVGGTAPYSYSWSNGSTSEDLIGVGAGTYQVLVTDANGCTNSNSYALSEPFALTQIGNTVDINCFGSSTGSIEVTVTGGTSPYTYQWSSGEVTKNLSNISAGSYDLTVTDSNGCSIVENYTITEPAAPLAAAGSATSVSCFGAGDGAITLNVTGGTAPYTYSWNQGSTTKDISILSPGAYQVEITDSKGCSVTRSFTITGPDELQIVANLSNVSCNGLTDGQVDITVSGGTAPYSYSWSDGSITEDLTGVGAGTYQVFLTDVNGCTLSRSFTVTEPLTLVASASINDVDCFGAGDGSIEVTVTGGTSPYTYQWSSGEVTKNLSNISGGNYDLTITDSNACSIVQNYTVAEPSAPLAATGSTTNVNCFGAGNGSIVLNVTGGTAPYTYSWNQGSITKDISALNPGGYQVEITDSKGCSVTRSFTITGPDLLQVGSNVNNVSCNGLTDGQVDITVSGGTAPYSYSWSDGSTAEDLTGAGAGTYQVLVTDANGCAVSTVVNLQEPSPLSVAVIKTDVDCFGDTNGAINLTVSGGTFPYTFSWSNGEVTEDLSGLTEGIYQVVVTDINGCSTTEMVTIAQPSAALNVTGIISDETCAGLTNGNIDLTVTGGVAPYRFSWNTGSTNEDILGLTAGVYQVTVTDTNGCEIQASFNVEGPQPITLSGVSTDVTCYQSMDGAIDVLVSGGTAPYTFSWTNGSSTEDINNLDIGNYSVTVIDSNGCTTSRNFVISQPLALTLSENLTHVMCFGEDFGAIDLTVSGGTGPYTYSWSSGQSTQDLTNLSGGAYTVTVVDSKGCSITKSLTIDAPVAELSVNETLSDASCFGQASGQVLINVEGGTAPYNFLWSNGSNQQNLVNVLAGSYTVQITDINGCQLSRTYEVGESAELNAAFDVLNSTCFGDSDGRVIVTASGGNGPYSYVWSNGSTSKDQYGLTGGTYNVTITDSNNCAVTKAVEVGDSRSLSVSVTKTDVLCKGESSAAIQLDITGGSGNYTYLWNTGEVTQSISALSAGIYSATVTDSGGCATTTSVVVSEPSLALSAEIAHSEHLDCFGDNSGLATITPTGGVAPYTYLWSTGERTASISSLQAGSYAVTVTDANGCFVQDSFELTEPNSPIEITVLGNTDLKCHGENDGSIQLSVSGGTGPYSYLWNTGATEDSIDNLSAGDYTVRIRDSGGCLVEKIISVIQPEELRIANVNINQSKCFDDRNGAIELDIQGGTLPYTYQWSTGATTKNIIGIPSGNYDLTVTDARGCEVSARYTLSDPALFKMDPDLLPITCLGANDGVITLNIEGGIEPMSIRWNTGASSETLTNLAPGQYNVVVTDGNDCSIQQGFNIIEPLPLTLDAYVEDAVKCGVPKSGKVSMIVSGGAEPYSYRWSNGENTSVIEDVLPGTYVVTVTDVNGCRATGTYTVQQPEPLQIGLSTLVVVDCESRQVSSRVVADVVGGTGGYSYEWNVGNSASEEVILTEPTRLTLVVSDGLGCQQMRSIDVRIPELAEADYIYESESIDRTGELAANEPVSFFDKSIGEAIDWSWTFGDGFDSKEVDPIHTFSAPGTYEVVLSVLDASGCTTRKSEILEITEGYRVMLPTAFTPNADGNNDFFRPKLLGLEKAKFLVFNTWGEVIFSTDDLESKGWDGKINGKSAENGNYVYKVIGVSFNGLLVERDGVFALIK